MSELALAVQTVVRRCMGIREGDEAVVVVDRATGAIGQPLHDEAAGAGADAMLMVMGERATDGSEPPAAAAVTASDVFIAPTRRSLSHTAARKRGARCHDAGRDRGDARAVMAVDFDPMAARSQAVSVPVHLVVVILDASLEVDRRRVLDAGRYVLE